MLPCLEEKHLSIILYHNQRKYGNIIVMDIRIKADIHTHTIASGHAYGTIREMAQEAREAGLELYGHAEHSPSTPGAVDPLYFLNLKVVPRRLYGVGILHGCEINVMNGGILDLKERYLRVLDYAYVGIHGICYKDEGRDRNTDNLIQCMKHEKVFFVSHPDDDHTPVDYDRLTDAALMYHVALEVNNSSFKKLDHRLNCVENYRTMLRLCEQKRVPVILGSDAHDPSAVGDVSLAAAFIEEVGFDRGLILNTDTDRLKSFIGLDIDM